jgi:hypothetical protein
MPKMTAPAPAWPAACIRVDRVGTPGDQAVQQQRRAVLAAAARLGWPQPAVCTGTGRPGWNRPGSALDRLTAAIRNGGHDAARISRATGYVTAFTEHCARNHTTVITANGTHLDPQASTLHAVTRRSGFPWREAAAAPSMPMGTTGEAGWLAAAPCR